MAQMVIGSIGQYVGSNLGLGTFGTMLGSVAGSLAASYLFPTTVKGSRLTDLQVTASTEGAAIARVDGTLRLAGQVIWASQFDESKTSSGGKGTTTKTTSYVYKISFAVGLCQGVVKTLGRIWADGNLLDTSNYTIRFYQGTESQTADSVISEIEGAGNTPAYRGLCYVVFEDMDVTDFGGRIPQLQFEISRPITAYANADALENVITAVNLIPGAGEFVYATTLVVADDDGTTDVQNGANACASTYADVLASLDTLGDVAPNLKSVSLVVGWFGSDLRAGQCTIKPKVESADKDTYGEYTDDDEVKQTDYVWKVDGIKRSGAVVVSYVDGYPAYGGTPCDQSVTQIIKELKTRGWKVTFYPFLFMDIAAGNSLPNPYSDQAATLGQPAYPWRGRITCSPAPGYSGSVDKTTAVTSQIESFFTGTWGYNRMVQHYADLCVAAGGVDSFLIGSELVGLTKLRSDSTTYPAVVQLKSLAATVKAAVGTSCKVGYAADWSEWNNHQTGDASGAVQFHLDPLWSDSHIDFIGIDNYLPLADWRDGTSHLDYAADGPTSIYDAEYLQGNIYGGEYYDWYYASDSDRDSQTRTTISDGTYNKPWVWRAKDFLNWWMNAHYNRVDGSESASATDWVPQSKPIRFTELGCPAVDKGANQPNVFYDAKSSESALPYYSSGDRDDLVQRAFLEAHYLYWADSANNPTSSVYSGRMIATDYTAAWCWDARPYPYFPGRSDLWSDTDNYTIGDWLNGRLGAVLLADLVTEICADAGFSDIDVSDLRGLVTGYARSQSMSARDELQSLSQAFFFDAVESQGKIKFLMRGQASATTLTEEDLVLDTSADASFGFRLTRTQDIELPLAYHIRYIDAANGYEQGSYRAKKLVGNANRIEEAEIALVMDRTQAGTIGDKLLQEAWVSRESAQFSLAPSQLALDPCDEVVLCAAGQSHILRISEITDGTSRAITAMGCDQTIYDNCTSVSGDTAQASTTKNTGRGIVVFMDLPWLTSSDLAYAPHLAAYADPWPSSMLVYRSASDTGYSLDTTLTEPADIGETLYDFYSGPVNRWDLAGSLYVRLYSGTLSSAEEITVLGGANVLAIANGSEWEILQFKTATLIDTKTWKLTGLLRGLRGSAANMASPLAAGARVVVLSKDTLYQSAIPAAQYSATFNYLWGPSDKSTSSSAYQSASLSFAGVGLRPFAPCHIDYSWDDSGNLTFYWIRCDRSPTADSWDQSEIPLSEDSESYALEIQNSTGILMRSVSGLTVSSYLYTRTAQAEDFGTALGQGTTLQISVYQISTSFGRGIGKTTTLYL